MIFTKEIVVRTTGKGIRGDPIKVNLPSYQIKEILPDNKANILIPDDEVDEIDIGNYNKIVKLNKDKIRQKYRGQKWDRSEVCDDVVVNN